MWGIWDCNDADWVRELPSKVDDGGEAVLAFTSEAEAKRRAAKHYGYRSYAAAKRDGHCEVRSLNEWARRYIRS